MVSPELHKELSGMSLTELMNIFEDQRRRRVSGLVNHMTLGRMDIIAKSSAINDQRVAIEYSIEVSEPSILYYVKAK